MASLFRSIISIFSGKVTIILIGSVFTPILVRVLTQAQYGLYATVLAGFSIITLISKGGLFDATRKTVAKYEGKSTEVSSIISSSIFISLIYGFLSMLIVFFSLLFGLIPSTYVPYIWILLSVIVFTNIFASVRGSFYGLQHESTGEALRIARRSIYSVSALLLAYVGYDVIGVFTGYAVSFALLSVLGAVLLLRHSWYGLPTLGDITTYGKEISSYGGYQLIGGLSAMLLYRTDILLVEFFEGATSTALYQSAITPAEMIWVVPSAIQLAFLQHTASLWSSNEIDKINENIRTGIKYAILSLTLFGVGLFALAEPFLTAYFGSDYTGAAMTLRILIFGTFFFGITRVVVPVFQATGLVRHTEFITFGALVLNILLNTLFIPQYGVIGAGIGTALSYISMFAGNIILWKYSQFNLVPLKWVAKISITQGIFAITFFGITMSINTGPWISLLVFPPVGLLLFIGVNITAGYIPTQPAQSLIRRATKYLF